MNYLSSLFLLFLLAALIFINLLSLMYPLTNKEIFGKSFISTYLLFLTNFQTIQISYLNLIKRDRGNSLLCEEQQI